MSYVLGWLLALLLTICPSLVAAADEIELCGQFDYYNSTTVPYSCRQTRLPSALVSISD